MLPKVADDIAAPLRHACLCARRRRADTAQHMHDTALDEQSASGHTVDIARPVIFSCPLPTSPLTAMVRRGPADAATGRLGGCRQ